MKRSSLVPEGFDLTSEEFQKPGEMVTAMAARGPVRGYQFELRGLLKPVTHEQDPRGRTLVLRVDP